MTRKMVKYRTDLTLFCLFVKWSSKNSPFLTSSLKKHTFYNLLINNILYLCVT